MASALDRKWMAEAIDLAEAAQEWGEVPVGAVVVQDGSIIGRGYNRPVSDHDPSAHAEIVALRDAAKNKQNYRLPGSTLYVTLEPCIMCAGAIVHARIKRLVFGCRDPRSGAAGSQLNLIENEFLNHQAILEAGVLEAECRRLLTQFFANKRTA
ncbi:MAG: tRNA adenosine(34) deaminase TadA [Granulosicoccus sp.]|nr:tRNA adenosine(34) deaminase TadA [Granulosicoccus sp.]